MDYLKQEGNMRVLKILVPTLIEIHKYVLSGRILKKLHKLKSTFFTTNLI